MNTEDILKIVDHTNLNVGAKWADIKMLCDQALKYKTASVCIAPSYVKQAAEYVEGKMAICTVIGFPNGYNTTACKIMEIKDAVENGASELDIVINNGWMKDEKYDLILNELKEAKKAAGDRILKVIVETCLLTEEEKIEVCQLVTEAGADFIKTSTGFSLHGATLEDAKLLVENTGSGVECKAAGGIKNLEDAKAYIELGVTRLGTSSIVKEVMSRE